MQIKMEEGEDAGVKKEGTNMKLVYELDQSSKNYDTNAVEHRIRQHSLQT